jgi:CheY-like chemotaxis protein
MLQDQMPRGFVVLVVDDDAETVTLLAQLIADAFGCRVLEATSGEEALRIVDSGVHVDLVFADVVMPEKDGLTLAHLLRRRTPDLPVVLVTGRPDVVDWVIENGGIALLKPYSIERLAAVLSEQLGIGATPN